MDIKSLIWNARSLNAAKIAQLTCFVEKHNFKILFITETWFHQRSNVGFHHFNCFRVDRHRGGVAIYVHKSIPHSHFHQISSDFAEAIFVKIHSHRRDYVISSIYCSPSASRRDALSFFDKVFSIRGPVVLSGDFNAKHHAWNNTHTDGRGSDLFRLANTKLFMIHPPDGPTLIPGVGVPSAVDFVLTKSIQGVSDPVVFNDLGSDHFPLSFSVPFNGDLLDFRVFNFRKANWKKFRSMTSSDAITIDDNFSSLDSPQAIEESISRLENSIIDATKASVPKRLPFSLRYQYSPELNTLTKARNLYRKRFLVTRDPAWRSAKQQLDKLIKAEVEKLNSDSFNKKVASLNTRDHSLFQFAKIFKRKHSALPPLKNPDTTLSFSRQDKADTLANAFHSCHLTTFSQVSSKDKTVAASIKQVDKAKVSVLPSDYVRVGKVIEIIKTLKRRKAPGPDNISNTVIQNLPGPAICLLTRIFNACLSHSYFPLNWKFAKIIAIPKPGKCPSIPTNHRPISLLSSLGKILEREILDRLVDFEEDKKIFVPHQFGFRKGHSTIQQIMRVTEKITFNFNSNKCTGMALLDVEKAFDSVWHDALIHKLHKLKFPMMLIKLVKSYLSDRRAFVDVSGSHSREFSIPAGVPQGSLLAPFLFNIFINDVPIPKDCELATYADDTTILCEAHKYNVKAVKKKLESAISAIQKHYSSWKININSSKTEFIIFTKSPKLRKRMADLPPTLNGVTLKWSDSVRYLGPRLDYKLTFKEHVETSIKQGNLAISMLFCLFKKKSHLDKNLKLLIYKAYIRPIITYAGTIIANCAATHLNKLQVFQNKCLRMALDMPYYTRTSELHEDASIPYVRDFIAKNAEKFYETAHAHESELIKKIGAYSTESLPFRVKHKLPKAL